MTHEDGKFDYWNVSSDTYERLLETKQALYRSGLSEKLLELVFLRVSQLNGCKFCIGLHRASARNAGATIEHIRGLQNWSNFSEFSELEKAAFDWAETVTNVSGQELNTPALNRLQKYLTEQELTDLTIAICLMNAMNRLAIAFGRS